MKTFIRKAYKCDHCGKNMLGAGAMSRHEKFCKKNPANQHKCLDYCRLLKREILPTSKGYCISEYTCKATGMKMYSYLAEKKNNYRPGMVNITGLTPMPLECRIFQPMTWSEIEDMYDKRYKDYDYEN